MSKSAGSGKPGILWGAIALGIFWVCVYLSYANAELPGFEDLLRLVPVFLVLMIGLAVFSLIDRNKDDVRAAIACGQFQQAESELKKRLPRLKRNAAGTEEHVQDLIALAKICHAGGRLDEADSIAREAVNYAEHGTQLMQASLDRGTRGGARIYREVSQSSLRSCLLLEIESAGVLGEILLDKGRYQEALDVIDAGLYKMRVFYADEAMSMVAAYFFGSKLLKLAARIYAINGDEDKVQLALSEASGFDQKGLEAAQSLAGMKPASPEPLILGAEFYISLEKHDRAIKELSRALELKPEKMHVYTIHLKRADCYSRLKDLDNAMTDVEAVLDMVPDSPLALVRRADVFEKLDMKDRALVDRQTAESLGVKADYIKLGIDGGSKQ